MKVRLRSILLMFLLGVSLISWAAPGVKMSVQMPRGRRSIAVGDVFYIQVQVTDMEGQVDFPKTVPGAKLNYFAKTGSSSSFSSFNGKTTQSSSSIYTATLRAEKEGSYSFGPIKVGAHESNKVSYAIGAAGSNVQQPPQPQSSQSNSSSPGFPPRIDPNAGPTFIGKGDGNLFMRASVSKTSAYEQEALVYTVKLYSTYSGIRFIGATSAPKFDGFVVEESKDTDTQFHFETYQGKQYATAIIARYIIFPQMDGKLKVQGNTYTVSVSEREYYHDPFFGTMGVDKPLQLNVTPNDLTVDVKPLPEPRPADFSGGVGRFHISSALKQTALKTNEAASIVYTITGSGNLKYVSMPDLNVLYPDELEVYSPTSDVKTEVGSSTVTGFIKYDYSFVPLETGEFKIPPVTLVYFNPATGQYERSTADGYTINVAAGKASAKSQTRDNLKFDSDLMKVGKLQKEHKPMVLSFGYWLWVIIPVLLLIGAVIGTEHYRKTHADLEALKSRKANTMARRRLNKARKAMLKGDRNLFIDELLNALWGYLGDKLRMPPSELSRENVSRIMDEHGVSQQAIDNVIKLLDDVEFAKYAPSAPGNDSESMFNRAVALISGLESEFKSAKKENDKRDEEDRIAMQRPTSKDIKEMNKND